MDWRRWSSPAPSSCRAARVVARVGDNRRRIKRVVARVDRRDDYGQLLASAHVIHEPLGREAHLVCARGSPGARVRRRGGAEPAI